jgi:hypothetical protein
VDFVGCGSFGDVCFTWSSLYTKNLGVANKKE